MGEVGKDSFITLSGKVAGGGGQWTNALKLLCPNLGKIVTSFIVIVQRECEQLADVLLMG